MSAGTSSSGENEALGPGGSGVAKTGWGFVLLGWLYALLVGNGSELVRLALIPLVISCGALMCVFGGSGRGGAGAVFVLGSGFYFCVRSWISPVWDEAQRDLFLVGSALPAFVAACSVWREGWARKWFVAVLVFGVVVNLLLAIYQLFWNEGFALTRGTRTDVAGVSGAFFHRNYFAGFLEIALPVFVALGVVRPRKNFWAWGLVLLGVWMTFESNSRGGFVALLAGVGMGFVWQLARLWSGLGRGVKVGILCGGGVVLAGGVLLAVWGFQVILEQRGASDSLDFGKQMDARLGMAGIGVDIWMRHFWFGGGAESFSYLFPRHASERLGAWFGDARMAHCDYVQVVADFGLVGLVAVGVVLGTVLVVLVKTGLGYSGWIGGAVAGALVAESFRAAMDFNLHVAPNLVLFALLVGGLMSTQGGQVTGFRGKALGLAGVLLVGFTAAFSGFPELRASGEWLGYEMALAKKNGEEVESRLRSYCERNAEFRPSRQLSRFSVTRVLGREAEEGDWEEAERDLRRVLARNPYDGESLANLARLLEEAGQFEEARNFHFRALGAVGAREQKYGVYFAYGMHLVKRGQERLAARNPEEGLAYFEEASVVLKHSFAKNYRRKEVVRPAQEWVRQQIDFLEGARIDAAVIPQISDWRTQQESADYAAFSWELR